jgi:hypothetical protein
MCVAIIPTESSIKSKFIHNLLMAIICGGGQQPRTEIYETGHDPLQKNSNIDLCVKHHHHESPNNIPVRCLFYNVDDVSLLSKESIQSFCEESRRWLLFMQYSLAKLVLVSDQLPISSSLL